MLNPDNSHKLLIPTFNSLEIVTANEIIYLEALENYCRINLINDTCIISTYSFGAVLEMISSLPVFKIHKSYAVHLAYVKRYLKTFDIETTSGKVLPVARRRKDDFLEHLKGWISVNDYGKERQESY